MGLPIHQFIAAVNDNDTFYQYLYTGEFKAKASVETLSNSNNDTSLQNELLALLCTNEELKPSK